jgi:hypothetical protein
MLIINEEKYITFKRSVFRETLTRELIARYEGLEIPDAVVIRRQDKFASPCLLTYAAMISMVAENCPEKDIKEQLQAIADYFHHQGVLAGEEGWKLPTP